MTNSELPDELLVANCANCGQMIQLPPHTQPHVKKKRYLPVIHKRVNNRPWCKSCYDDPGFHPRAGECYRTEGQRVGKQKTWS